MTAVLYDEEKMKRFVDKDRYLSFVFNDLQMRNHSKSDALLYIFNSNVLNDTAMEDEYNRL